MIIDVREKTREFLSNADMVKFAKFQPMPSVNETMLQQAYDIVNKTIQEKTVTEVEEVKTEEVNVQ